jgi:calcineurin-like phosphoesterase family protein
LPKLIIKKVEKMSLWFTSDYHFGHTNIIKYCNRPFETTHEMNKEIIRRHNEVVAPGDIVYFLGDFAFNNAEVLMSKMNGIFLFILGNHDRRWIKNKAWKHTIIEYDKIKLLLTHNPRNIYGNFTLNIVGHVHEKWLYRPDINAYNVSVDVHNFYPVSFNDIVTFCEKKGI